jgi:VWFA-related protein
MRMLTNSSNNRRAAASRSVGRLLAALALALLALGQGPLAQQQAQQQNPNDPLTFTLTTDVNIVSVDVVVRDRQGNVVRGLTEKDFQILEDGKPQVIETFSFQEIATDAEPSTDEIALLENLEEKLRAEAQRAATATADVVVAGGQTPDALRGRRMFVLLFDVSSMQPEDVQRAVEQSMTFVDTELQPADLVAVVSIGSRLNVLSDFTSSRENLLAGLQALAYQEGTDIDLSALISTVASDADAAAAETASGDASGFEEFNNDVRLRAIKTLCETLMPIQQRKAVLYFSAGMRRSGDDNQIELRNATNACSRANTNIYPADARGLQAVVAGGGATQRSSGGQGLFTGANATRGFSQLSASQETLTTLAADTGGRAFTDSNDFSAAFARVQRDLADYYLLGYSSTNPARDGGFRRIQVRVTRKDLQSVNVEARPGYYAGRSFANTNRRDREAQLDDQLAAAVSSTDVPMVLGTGWFRQNKDRFYVPIVMAVPGSSVPVATNAKTVSLDVKGEVYDEQGRRVGGIRDTLEVPAAEGAETLAGRQVVYQSGVSLPPGRFSVKVVVRENTGGAVGSFESLIVIPQLSGNEMRVSSVVMSTQLQPVTGRNNDNPLVRDGAQLLPNLTRVVGRNQKIYFHYEVYDPTLVDQAPHLRTNLAFYRNNIKVSETPVVERVTIDDTGRRAVVFQFEVDASAFRPGQYTCQINVIDAAGSQVAFPRLSFVVLD